MRIYVFYILFFLSFYIYAAQVFFKTYALSYLFYIFMFVALIATLCEVVVKDHKYSRIRKYVTNGLDAEKIAFLLGVYLGLNGLCDVFDDQNYMGYLRVLVFYCLPILYFVTQSKVIDIKVVLTILSVSGLFIGLETLWEFINIKVTSFEQSNFNYVKDLTGKELTQLLGTLRPTGLIEHLHVTAFVLAVSFFGSTILFLEAENKIKRSLFFIISLVLILAIVGNGSKLVILGVMLAWSALFAFNRGERNKLLVQLLLGSSAVLMLYYLTNHDQYFWQVVYFQYPVKLLNLVFPSHYTEQLLGSLIYIHGNEPLESFLGANVDGKSALDLTQYMKLTPLNVIFGLGYGDTSYKLGMASDDMYVFQFFVQLGIIGGVIFFALIFQMIRGVMNCQRNIGLHNKLEELMLLSFLILLPFILLHSGVLHRKTSWILFCLSIVLAIKIEEKLHNKLMHI